MDNENKNQNITNTSENETGCLPILILIFVMLIVLVFGGNIIIALTKEMVHLCGRGGRGCREVFLETDPIGFVLGISKDVVFLSVVIFLFIKFIKSSDKKK